MQNDHDKTPDSKSKSLRKRIAQVGALVLTATLLAGCYVGPAGYYGGGGGGGYHHHWH